MVMGGVEKELISILKHLDPKLYDLTVILLYIEDQSVVDMLPPYVKIINLDIDKSYYCSDTFTASKKRLRRGKVLEGISLMCKKIAGIGQTGSNISLSELSDVKGYFDTAVCFHLHSPLMVKFIAEKVKADKKLAWIHNDFSTSGYRVDKIVNYLKSYNEIIGVSGKITDEFKQLCPTLSHRAKVIYNALDKNEILEKSKELIPQVFPGKETGSLILLTVGRLEQQKGYDTAVRTAEMLMAEGFNFLWYVIGEGSKRSEIEALIEKSGLSSRFILLGRKDNPYPFIKACDIYVQPSRHEGYPLTVLEAKILGKPIICTDFAGAQEQIQNSLNGYIVPVDDSYALAAAIMRLAKNKETQSKFISALQKENMSDKGFSEIINCL